MNVTNTGAIKYTLGLQVGNMTLDPVVIWGEFRRNANWILATGIWNDNGVWDDSANWID